LAFSRWIIPDLILSIGKGIISIVLAAQLWNVAQIPSTMKGGNNWDIE